MNGRRLSLLAALLASLCVPGRAESSLQGRADSSLQLLIDIEDPENPARDATGNYATSSVALGTAAADDPKRGAHSGDFNGVDTSISIDTPLQWPAEVTFAVWFQEDADAVQEYYANIFQFYQDINNYHSHIGLQKNSNLDQYYFIMYEGQWAWKRWDFDTQPGVWNFFCVSIQADKTWTLFHNGNLQVLSNQWAMDTSLTYTSSKVGMEASVHANNHFHGKIDELAIFNRALSAAEISELYANGLTTPQPGPRAGFQYKQRVTKVTTTMSMPLTVEEFTVDAQREYKETVAAVVGVHADQVTIVSVTAQ
jgi:hypothetical protein